MEPFHFNEEFDWAWAQGRDGFGPFGKLMIITTITSRAEAGDGSRWGQHHGESIAVVTPTGNLLMNVVNEWIRLWFAANTQPDRTTSNSAGRSDSVHRTPFSQPPISWLTTARVSASADSIDSEAGTPATLSGEPCYFSYSRARTRICTVAKFDGHKSHRGDLYFALKFADKDVE